MNSDQRDFLLRISYFLKNVLSPALLSFLPAGGEGRGGGRKNRGGRRSGWGEGRKLISPFFLLPLSRIMNGRVRIFFFLKKMEAAKAAAHFFSSCPDAPPPGRTRSLSLSLVFDS